MIYKFSWEIPFRVLYIVIRLKKHYLNAEKLKHFEMKKVKDQSRFDSSLKTVKNWWKFLRSTNVLSSKVCWGHWEIKCGGRTKQGRVPKNRKLKVFLSFRDPYWEESQIRMSRNRPPSHTSTSNYYHTEFAVFEKSVPKRGLRSAKLHISRQVYSIMHTIYFSNI